MGAEHADQLAPLSEIFGDVYRAARPARLALLGCATGNGLEHVDPSLTMSVVAIDFHPDFVALTQERYGPLLGEALEVVCADLTSCALPPGSFDLVHAALVFEHVEPSVLVSRIATWLAPNGTCAVVLQSLDAEGAAAGSVTSSPYRTIAALQETMRHVSVAQIDTEFERHAMRRSAARTIPLKGAKKLEVREYRRG